MTNPFAEKLKIWYKNHMRALPWRETRDPYKVWLSEIILQQTRVKQGLPYYEKFVENYPTVQDLAQAPLDEVLRLWQGLGYYSRARNLHSCAQMIVNDYQGKFPETYEELQKLKGIGKYTAAAIASFAFHKPVPVVDGNVFRVLSRLFCMSYDIANTKNFKYFFEASQSLMPASESEIYNQAMMELGATVCTPTKPACLLCPVESFCQAKEKGEQSLFPVKLKKVKVRKRFFYYLVLEHEGQVIMQQRGPKDIWQGLYDFPLIESSTALDEEELLHKVEKEFHIELDKSISLEISAPVKHILTHQKIEAYFISVETKSPPHVVGEAAAKYSMAEIEDLPKPVLVNNYLKGKFN